MKKKQKHTLITISEDERCSLDTGLSAKPELIICPVITNELITQVHIYVVGTQYKYVANNPLGWDGIDIESFFCSRHHQDAYIWRTFYCKEHKCLSMRLYVPNNAAWFYYQTGLDAFCLKWE